MHRQVLELRKKVLGREHSSIFISMNNLASVLGSQGKYLEAEQMRRQVLELMEEVRGREHPDTVLYSILQDCLKRIQEKMGPDNLQDSNAILPTREKKEG